MKAVRLALASLALLAAGPCTPDVGSEGWCDEMRETPKGDWTANQAADYLQYCVLQAHDR